MGGVNAIAFSKLHQETCWTGQKRGVPWLLSMHSQAHPGKEENVQRTRKQLHLKEGGERCWKSHCLTGFSGSGSERND